MARRRQSITQSDVDRDGGGLFSEIIVGEERATGDAAPIQHDQIQISGRAYNVSLPATYPVEDLVKVILAIEGHA